MSTGASSMRIKNIYLPIDAPHQSIAPRHCEDKLNLPPVVGVFQDPLDDTRFLGRRDDLRELLQNRFFYGWCRAPSPDIRYRRKDSRPSRQVPGHADAIEFPILWPLWRKQRSKLMRKQRDHRQAGAYLRDRPLWIKAWPLRKSWCRIEYEPLEGCGMRFG